LPAEKEIDDGPLTSERTYSLKVEVGFTVSGIVVEADSGKPLAGASLAMGFETACTTDADGEFSLSVASWSTAVKPLRTRLVASHADHVACEVDVPEPETGTAVQDVEVVLERGVTLSGRVIDTDGKGVRAEIAAMQLLDDRCALGRRIAHCVSARSLDDGSFTLPPMPAVQNVQVRARVPSQPPACIRDIDLRRPRKDLVIRLRPRVLFDVTATYPDGSPVSPGHGELVFVDSNGEMQNPKSQSPKGWQFGGEVGHSHAFSVRAKRAGEQGDRVYAGSGTALAPEPLGAGQKVDLAIVLSEMTRSDVPPQTAEVSWMRSDGYATWGFTWLIDLVDAETQKPISASSVELTNVAAGGGGARLTNGRFRLTVGPGVRQLVLRAPGYESLSVETEGLDHGYAEVALPLQRR
jgi:hypothetical protein